MPKTITRKPIEQTEGFTFDPVAHVYTLNGKPLHGVTTILKVIAKPALIGWAVNMACDHIKSLGQKEIDGIPYYLVQLSDLEEARTAHNKKKEDAGAKGTDVHAEIETYIKKSIELCTSLLPASPTASPQTQKFVEWAIANNVKFLSSEERLYNEEYWYAGTADFICEMNGKRYVGDVKTSSAIYPEYFIQASAYAYALTDKYSSFDGVIIVNVPKRGGLKVEENYDLKGNFECFKACLTIHNQLNAIKK